MLIPPRVLKSAGLCTDAGSTRYSLGCVLVERHDGQPWATSTDGRKAVSVTWREQEPRDFPAINGCDREPAEDFRALIPANAWADAAKLLTKRVTKPILSNVLLTETGAKHVPEHPDRQEVEFAATDLESPKVNHVRCVAGTFPRFRDFINPMQYRLPSEALIKQLQKKVGIDAVEITLDPWYLVELCKSAIAAIGDSADTKRGVTFRVPICGERAVQMRYTVGAQHDKDGNETAKPVVDWRGVLMPLAKD